MRILYTHFKAGHGGGGDTYILALAEALASEHDIAIAVPEGSRIHQRLSSKFPTFAITAKPNWRTLVAFKRWVNQQRPDIIHSNTARDHLITKALSPWLDHKPKWVYTRHNTLPVGWKSALRLRYLSDAVVAVSKYTYEQLPCTLAQQTMVKVIRNGVDTDFYQPITPEQKSRLRAKYGFTDNDLVFTSVAGTDPIKNWIMLVEAIAQLPVALKARCKIILAGAQPHSTLVEQITQLHMTSQVIFPGLMEDVREIIAVGDVGFVLSKLEGLSFACREMMAMGLPVIASNVGGLPENITDRTDGWIVPAHNVSQLKHCVEHILTSAHLPKMAEQARQKAQAEFSQHQFVSETAALYQAFLNLF